MGSDIPGTTGDAVNEAGSTIPAAAQLELLNAHYHEVLGLLNGDLKVRILLVLGCIGVVVLMIFSGFDPCNNNTIMGIASDYFEAPSLSSVDPLFVSLLSWFALAFLMAQSCQRSLVIEQRAAYLRHLESRIDCLTADPFAIALMRYKRPKFFTQVNKFYLSTFLVSVSLVGLGKLVLDAKTTVDLFCPHPSVVTQEVSDRWRDCEQEQATGPRSESRPFFAVAFIVVEAWMFLVIVYFARQFVRDFPTAGTMAIHVREWKATIVDPKTP